MNRGSNRTTLGLGSSRTADGVCCPVKTAASRRYLLLALIAAPLLAATGCRGGSSSAPDIPSYVRSELPNASEFERTLLADGKVTESEYEHAVLEMLRCAEEHGINHSEPVLTPQGISAPKWKYVVGPWPIEEDAKYQAMFQACFDEYEQAIQTVWVLQEAPSEEEQAKAKEQVIQCLLEHDLVFPDYATFLSRQSSLDAAATLIARNCELLAFRGEDHFR